MIRQRVTTPTENTITVKSGDITLTIADLNIVTGSSPISVTAGATLTLNAVGTNRLASNGSAVIYVPKDAELIIQGTGVVDAIGGRYGNACIGGSGSKITINGGTVNAAAEDSGSGIGGPNSTVMITGGSVTAAGGYHAGIGGNLSAVTITGGTVTATGGSSASGIGGTGSVVDIQNDAVVNAYGYYHSIGGNSSDNENGCSRITISASASVTTGPTVNHSSAYTDFQEKLNIKHILRTPQL